MFGFGFGFWGGGGGCSKLIGVIMGLLVWQFI